MLSIGKIGNDVGRQRYYDNQVAKGVDDYYHGVGEAPGEWVGTGAEFLGISGRVEDDQLLEMFAGRNPITGEQIYVRPGSGKVAGFDLTFSAPKSISVLFAAHPELREKLINAHERAVDKALGYIEDRAIQVQRGRAGKYRHKGLGIIGAKYRHRMSRAEDPQLHTHVVIANWTLGQDGKWSSLVHPVIYENAKAGGLLYQAFLRHEVHQELAWARWVSRGNGLAELAEDLVPADARKEFSRRTAEIQHRKLELANAGIHLNGGRGEHDILTKTSRAEKRAEPLSNDEWYEALYERLFEHGLTAWQIETDLMLRPHVPTAEPLNQAALSRKLFGPTGLTEKSSTFTIEKLIGEVAAAYDNQLAGGHEAVYEVVDRMIASPEVVLIADEKGPKYTTKELLGHEQAIVELDREGRDAGVGLVDSKTVDIQIRKLEAAHAAKDPENPLVLGAEQRAVLHGVTSTGNRVDVIEALAGTGKTTIAEFIRTIYEGYGYEVVGGAPTARAVRELSERAGVQTSRTLDSWMMSLDNNPQAFEFHDISWTGVRRKPVVFLIDEAGMVHTRMLSIAMQAAARGEAKIILIGDSGQLQSVGAGGGLAALTRERLRQNIAAKNDPSIETVPLFELTEVRRQRDPKERAMLRYVHHGHEQGTARFLDYIAEKQQLHIFGGDTAGLDAETSAMFKFMDGVNDEKVGLKNIAILSRDNERRRNLNQLVRAKLNEHGQLGASVTIDGREFAIGERILLKRNDKDLDLDNGMRGTVTGFTGHGITVELDENGGIRTLPVEYVAAHVDYAYAITVHAAQGATFESTIVIGQPGDFTREWAYTALSRHRGRMDLILVDDMSAAQMDRTEIAPNVGPEPLDARARMQYRMQQADAEWLATEELERAARNAAKQERDLAMAAAVEEQRLAQGAEMDAAIDFDPLEEIDRTLSLAEQLGDTREQFLALGDQLADTDRLERLQVAEAWQAVTQNIEVRETIAQQSGQLTDQYRDELEQLREAQRVYVERLGDTHPLTIIGQDRDLQEQFRRVSLKHNALGEFVEPKWVTDQIGNMPVDAELRQVWITAAQRLNEFRMDRGITHPNVTGLGRLTPRLQTLIRSTRQRLGMPEPQIEQDLGPEI